MSRDILSGFGPDASKPQAPRATSGGVTQAKPLPYSPPQGPTNQMRQGPGLGGTNLGYCGTQEKRSTPTDGSSGSPGLHGSNRGMGTNRKG